MFSRFGEMDDLYLPLGHPASSAGARYPDAGSQGLDTSFSFMDPQMVSEDPAAMDAFRTAHDDLCLDRPDCLTLGVYNTPDVFHRNPPSHMAFRARNSLPIAPAGHSIPQQMYQPDMFSNVSYADIQQMQTSNPFQTTNGPIGSPFPAYSQIESHGVSRVDDDCLSIAASSRCSQCSLAEPCTGTSCANDACANEPDACTDQECVRAAVTPEVATAALALHTMFGDGHDQPQTGFQDQTSGLESLDFSLHGTGQDIFNTDDEAWLNSLGLAEEHIREAHSDPNFSACMRPCPVVDNPIWFQQCHFRQLTPECLSHEEIPHEGSSNSYLHDGHHYEPHECGVKNANPQAFIKHITQEHLPLMAGMPLHMDPDSQDSHMLSPALPSSSESVNTFDASLLSTPVTPNAMSTPPTPFSSKDATSIRGVFPDLSDPALSRPQSSASLHSQVTMMTKGDENKCFWCDDTDSENICGAIFHTSNELHEHVIKCHIKGLSKGPAGFICGWQQCRREEQGKQGFPQRSKIERHMQTHTGCKPHVCSECHQVFSAKQALEQHKLIHGNERPLKCDYPGCGKTFRQQSALTMHKRTHTGEKPLKCEHCGRAFSESSNLSKHRRIHEVKGRFACAYPGCNKDFHRQDQLRRHMKVHPLASEWKLEEDGDSKDQVQISESEITTKVKQKLDSVGPGKDDLQPIRKMVTGVKKRSR